MKVSGKARRRRENFGIFTVKIIDFIKKIDQNGVSNPKKFLGASGAEGAEKILRVLDMDLVDFLSKIDDFACKIPKIFAPQARSLGDVQI